MRLEVMQMKKRISIFALAFMILISVLFGNGEDLPSYGNYAEARSDEVFLSGSASSLESIKNVDEINMAVFHTILIRRISHKLSQRIQRIILKLFIATGIALIFLFVAYLLVPQRHQSRTVLIRYLHKSDGKK